MALSVGLEIAIALAALFWLLATASSYVVEAFDALRNARGKALQRFVCEMVLGDPPRLPGRFRPGSLHRRSSADPLRLLSHGGVASLSKPTWRLTGDSTPPSYIPATRFAQALVDRLLTLLAAAQRHDGRVLARDLGRAAAGALRGTVLSHPLTQLLNAGNLDALSGKALGVLSQALCDRQAGLTFSSASDLLGKASASAQGEPASPGEQLFAALAQALNDLKSELGCDDQRRLADVVGTTETLALLALWRLAGDPPSRAVPSCASVARAAEVLPLPKPLRDALAGVIADANSQLENVLHGIESWFNQTMDRATGWFTRQVRAQLALCGLLAAVLANVNPFALVQDLAADPAVRVAAVQMADVKADRDAQTVLVNQLALSEPGMGAFWVQELERRFAGLAQDRAWLDRGSGLVEASTQLAHGVLPLLLRSPEFAGSLAMLLGDPQLPPPEHLRREVVCHAHLRAVARSAHARPTPVKMPTTTEETLRQCKDFLDTLDQLQVRAGMDDVQCSSFACAVALHPGVFWRPSASLAVVAFVQATTTWTQRMQELDRSEQACRLGDPDANACAARVDAQRREADELLRRSHADLDWALRDVVAQARKARSELDGLHGRLNSLGGPPLKRWSSDLAAMLLELAGWLMTMLAVALGAPFWHDLMGKLVDARRSTGPKPATGSGS